MHKGSLSISKTARYFLSGPPDGNYSTICFALHGYGQLASFFSLKFQQIHKDVLFICPEGLHRFYLKDSKGRVGASWMTKEDRLVDIDDYVGYLDQLYDHFAPQIARAQKVGILGFSQGVATSCRWLTYSKYTFNFLINWAGAFPPDLDFDQAIDRMQTLPTWMVVGDQDEYISEEDKQAHLRALKQKGFHIRERSFKGTHAIYPEVLKDIMGELIP